jgi:hypothetical protein
VEQQVELHVLLLEVVAAQDNLVIKVEQIAEHLEPGT